MGGKITEELLMKLGFRKLTHYTIQRAMIYDLGRNRHLSIGCIGTPNEVLFISQTDAEDSHKITDTICLHNYDYDGYLSEERLRMLVNSIGQSERREGE